MPPAESAHPTPLLDPASAGASILSPEAAPAAGDFADLGDLEDITGGEYRRQLLLDQLEADYDELAADAGRGWDVSHDAMIGNLLASPAGDARPRPLPPLTPERAERVGQSVPVEGPRDGPATGAPVRAHGGEGARVRLDFGADLDFEWIEPDGKKDRPLQGAAKSNATILLTGSRHSISVNSLLQEDNHIFEDLLPPLVRAKGLVLGHPQRILVRAVLLALLRGIPDSELVDKYALHVVPRLRAGLPLDKAMTEALFPRRKKGTTKYEMAEGLAAVFEDYGLPWPGKCISDADAIYLRDKYDSKKGTHLHARSYIHAQGGV